MTSTVIDRPPILDIPDYMEKNMFGLSDFPKDLFCIVYPEERYAVYVHEGIHGLACFTVKECAQKFIELVPDSKATVQSITFDDARDIAKIKAKTTKCCCIMLLDKINEPEIHYVK